MYAATLNPNWESHKPKPSRRQRGSGGQASGSAYSSGLFGNGHLENVPSNGSSSPSENFNPAGSSSSNGAFGVGASRAGRNLNTQALLYGLGGTGHTELPTLKALGNVAANTGNGSTKLQSNGGQMALGGSLVLSPRSTSGKKSNRHVRAHPRSGNRHSGNGGGQNANPFSSNGTTPVHQTTGAFAPKAAPTPHYPDVHASSYFPQIGGASGATGASHGLSPLRMAYNPSASHAMGHNTMQSPAAAAATASAIKKANKAAAQAAAAAAYTGPNQPVIMEEGQGSAVTSLRGLKPNNPNWINQDNYLIWENGLPDLAFSSGGSNNFVRVYGVFDGHGENGHLVSRRCRENFPRFMMANVSQSTRIQSSFQMMHNDLVSSELDVRCSGATCVIATVTPQLLTIYNCGDSRAVLGKRVGQSVTVVVLSRDHKPDVPEERKRIQSCGGQVGCRQMIVQNSGRPPMSVPMGPSRVWYQHRGETLGLAMSRSLGDSIVHASGVSAEPELTEHKIEDSDAFVILATDGVWDVVDNNQAVQMVHSFVARSPDNWSASEASSFLCKFARSRWEKLSPMIDDITCIVVKLH